MSDSVYYPPSENKHECITPRNVRDEDYILFKCPICRKWSYSRVNHGIRSYNISWRLVEWWQFDLKKRIKQIEKQNRGG